MRSVHVPRAPAPKSRGSPERLRGLGVGKGDRVVIYMPMVPEAVMAMLACARLGAIHSVVFGGFAAPRARRPDRRLPAEGHRVGLVRDRADADRRVQAAPRPRRSSRGDGDQPVAASSFSARSATAALVEGRDLNWEQALDGAEPADMRAGRGHRPALHPLHLGHDRAPKGDRARQRRPRRRAQWSMGSDLRRAPGRRVLGGLGHRLGGRATPTSSTARFCGLHHRALRGQAGRHARRRRILAGVRATTGWT